MPSPRKRIGFLPTEEVHDIIDKISRANEFSQSKVTGLLVEEALRSRGVLNDSFRDKSINVNTFFNNFLTQEPSLENNKSSSNSDIYKVNKITFSDDIKMMHEFVEFKYFKKVMKQNNDIIE
tara:strand:- start:415 stop:780 length:366 start_codon:yes stop_codon:yes gene_type:complete